MKISNPTFKKFEVITLTVITLLAVFKGQATVFYLVYLFWFQELIRTLIDLTINNFKANKIVDKIDVIRSTFFNFFLLFVYGIFIIVTFGLLLDFKNKELFKQNILVFFFRNWYFNINLILFSIQYIIYRHQSQKTEVAITVFNKRHIILHLSIILGAVIQMILVPRLPIDQNIWTSVLVIVPFLLLKIFLDRDYENSEKEHHN